MLLQVKSIIKYLALGVIIALMVFKVLGDRITREEVIMLGLAIAFVSALLDIFFPVYYIEFDASKKEMYSNKQKI